MRLHWQEQWYWQPRHAVSRPPVVEVEATEGAISLAKLAKAPLYVAHVTAVHTT